MKRQNIRKAMQILALLFFPVTIFYFSPYLIIRGAFKGVMVGSFVTFILIFLAALVLGRSFCSWVCPAGALHELMRLCNDKAFTATKAKRLKYILWIPWILTIVLGFVISKEVITFDPFYMTNMGISLWSIYGYIIYVPMVMTIYILSMTIGNRGMCHTICWMAPFMVLGEKIGRALPIARWSLSASSDRCVGCGKCNKVCSMSLEVMTMVQTDNVCSSDCILCGDCVDQCPKKAIEIGMRKPTNRAASSTVKRIKNPY